VSKEPEGPTEDTAAAGLGARPEPDRLALEVARAAIASKLFADEERVEIGRYQLLERVGAGGMGVVWGAWDPKLERRVALKLVSATIERDRDAMLVEGQALAKLSHPNVVPVYDVGVAGERVYLVMEWVRGTNLREHLHTPRTPRGIVGLFAAAGAGLEAAHAAGLVHRDFKPDNVMVGEDGRVRVVDFGIALALGTDGARRAGTPRYMAPEQARGEAVTAAADQYAFCVALREALPAMPAWIEAIVTRGTAADPAARYPDMTALLHALGRDPARVWRRRLLAAGVVAVGAGAFAIGTLRGGTDAATCTGSAAAIGDTWSDSARTAMLTHVRGLGAYGAEEAGRLDTDFTRYRAGWIDAHRGACQAHARGELTPQLYERGLACLARARVALQIVVDVTATAPIERFADVVVAARGLPALDRCADGADDADVAPPPPAIAAEVDAVRTDLTRARYLTLAGDPQAVPVATAAAAAADRLAYTPLVARAQLGRGAAFAMEAEGDQAVAAYERATAAALDAGDDLTFVEAFARELFALRRMAGDELPPDVADTPASIRFVERVAKRTGAAGAFVRALLYNNAGTERLARGELAAARTWFRRALDEPQPERREIELWTIHGNLALVTEDPAERDRLFREGRAHLERELGPHHAFTLEARLTAAMFLADKAAALAELREVADGIATYQPQRLPVLRQASYELGWLAEEAGDTELARTAMKRAEGGVGASAEVPGVYLHLLAGENAAAARVADELAGRYATATAWWQRLSAVDALIAGAVARARLGQAARARTALERALALLDDREMNRGAAYYQRRLARVGALLSTAAGSR
jgi:eukaryotic-like serine/threonine-protein kinase